MSVIVFTEKNHEYRRIDNVLYLSVSSFKDRFKEPYRLEHNANKAAFQEIFKEKRYKALKDEWEAMGLHILQPEYISFLEGFLSPTEQRIFPAVVDGVKKKWAEKSRKALKKGNLYHAAQERKALEHGYVLNPYDGLEYPVYLRERSDGNESLDSDLSRLPDGCYPELLISYDFPEPVYDPIRREPVGGIAGQADLAFLGSESLEIRFSTIMDYKTNSKPINGFGFKIMNLHRAGEIGYERYRPPINNYVVCTKQDYNLQLNLYAWMLFQVGYESRSMGIHHLNENLEVPNLFPDIENMVQHYLSNCKPC